MSSNQQNLTIGSIRLKSDYWVVKSHSQQDLVATQSSKCVSPYMSRASTCRGSFLEQITKPSYRLHHISHPSSLEAIIFMVEFQLHSMAYATSGTGSHELCEM